jgi:hypothetical protein
MAQEKEKVRELKTGEGPRITWDYSGMRSSYANVCNAQGTREEVTLFFGITHPSQQGDQPGATVQLNERVILSPFAAKRLAALLGRVVEQYEARFGSLGEVPAVEAVPTTTN